MPRALVACGGSGDLSCSGTVGQEIGALAASAGVAHRMSRVASWSAPFPAELLSAEGLRRFRGRGPDPRWRAWHEVHIMHVTRQRRTAARRAT